MLRKPWPSYVRALLHNHDYLNGKGKKWSNQNEIKNNWDRGKENPNFKLEIQNHKNASHANEIQQAKQQTIK